MNLLRRLWKDEEGQGLVEYVLIIALISIVIIALGPTVAAALKSIFNKVIVALGGTAVA